MTRAHQYDVPQPPLRIDRGGVALRLHGSQAGDAMALAAMRADRTLPEPTHEVQVQLGGEWHGHSVGPVPECQRFMVAVAVRMQRGKVRYSGVRMVPRVAR